MKRPTITARRSGLLSTLRWRTRITLWAAALAAGVIVAGFAKLAELALALFGELSSGKPWLPLLLSPLVGMSTVWLTRRYFPGAQGSGIPQVIAATRLAAQGKVVRQLVSLRIAFGKVSLGAFALIGGFSSGREGPSVQVAASILHAAHKLLPNTRALRASDLVLAGGAAGVAAAFNTPLAGIVFAVEELGRRLETRTSGVLVSTIILSGLVAIALLGNYNYFGHVRDGRTDQSLLIPVIAAGVSCGVFGGLFSRLMLLPMSFREHALWRWRETHPILFAGSCGVFVALTGFISGGVSYGSGYTITAQVVAGQMGLPWYAAPCRFLATLASYYSGIPGGIFAPSLAIGAAIGSPLTSLLGIGEGIPAFIALCMAGFLAAVTQAPITAAIIVMEMIDGHGMVISLMAVTLIAKAIASRLSPELYQQLALGFLPSPSQGPAQQQPPQTP